MKRLLVCLLLVGVVGCGKDVSKEATEIAQLTEAIESDPTNPLNYYERALLYGAAGQKEQAITDFTKVIELDPTNIKAYYFRGESYRHLAGLDRLQEHYWEELEKAIGDFTKVIELDAEHGNAYVGRGDAYRKLGERDKADADFAKAKELGYEPEDE